MPVDEEPVSLRSAPSPRRSPIRKAPIPAVIIDSDDEDNEVLVEEIIEERVEVAPRRRSPKKDKPVEVEGETGDEQTAKQDGEKEGAEPPSGMAVKIFAVVAAVLLTSLGGYAGLRKARPDLVASFEGRVHAVSADIGLPHFNLLGGETLPDFGPITESVSNTFAKAKERAGEAYVAASESVAGAWSAAGRKASDAAIMAGEFASSARNAAYSTGSAATEAAKRRWEAIRAALPSLSLPVPQRAAVFAPDGSMDTTGLATKEDVENLLRMIKGLQEEKASIGVLKGLAVKEDVGQVRAELSQLASQVQQEREEAPIRRTEEGLDLTPELRTKIRNLAADVGVGQGGNAAPGAPSWDTFYDENGRRLRDVIRGEIDSRPAPIDRAELLELVRSELEQLRTELDQLRGQVDRVAAIDQNAGGSLDELDAVMSRFAADRIAISDYALASAGARVLPELTSPTFERPPDKPVSGLLSRILGVGVVDGRPPVEAISKGDNMGECWPMNGAFQSLVYLRFAHMCFPL